MAYLGTRFAKEPYDDPFVGVVSFLLQFRQFRKQPYETGVKSETSEELNQQGFQ
jgi:hypothetical protein